MEEGIYRMSLAESFLVLIIIGLWLFAVINLARKLERICNPPSIFLNYSTHNQTSLSPSTFHKHYPNNLIQSTGPLPIYFVRATSEPAIDASPRTAIHLRSPSETCLYTKSSASEQMSSTSTPELERSNSSLNLPHHNDYRIHIETISDKPIPSQKLLNPKRIPSIVRRSLLDLHRRALYSNTSSNSSITQCVVTTKENPTLRTTTKIPLIKTKYQRRYAIDEDDC